MTVEVVEGDLLRQPVEAIVNAWNRNVIPWWLLLPQGVSGAIKRHAGVGPFVELGRTGPLPLGEARVTSAGRLPFRAIIHVAAINLWWRGSEKSIRGSVRNALVAAQREGLSSLAIPLLGSGSGGVEAAKSLEWILDELASIEFHGRVVVVRWKPPQ
jgi:O-acetyl-ADP-ribose deacetylase (regulator of RNase III)